MLELFGSSACPYTTEMRDWLEFSRREFVEFDVDADPAAMTRMCETTGQRTVPALLEDGKVVQIGWQGRGCVVGSCVVGSLVVGSGVVGAGSHA
jgi:glutaredoxin 3